jgi:tripartite-type tricarboxylate transporter receptor subunit TctC
MKRFLALLLVAVLSLTAVSALAEWPERAIELIVPANPGGDTDANARALAAALTEELGWNVIVSNMNGGSGSVAFEDCLSNPSDGYRFVFYHNGGVTSEIMGMYDFNILDDFKLAGMPFMDYSNAFLTNAANTKFNDTASMVAYMKDHPNEVTFATETGNFTHLQVLAFEAAAGVKFNIVNAGTAAQKVVELVANRLDVIGTQAGLSSVRDYETTGEFICLGTFAEGPIQMGDVELKSFKDQGYDVVFSKFFYLAAPNKVDDSVIAKMNEGLQKVLENEKFKEYANSALLNLTYMTPEETEKYYQEQYDMYAGFLLAE